MGCVKKIFMVFLWFCLSSTTTATEIFATGGTLSGPMYNKWNTAFFHEVPSIDIIYIPTSTFVGKASISNPRYLFTGMDNPLTSSEEAEMRGAYDFPSVAVPLAFVYNLPQGNSPLVMTFDLLAKIFSGKITRWDHPDIQQLNPDFEITTEVANRTIELVLRPSASGTTELWSFALNRSSFWPPLGVFNSWPNQILSAPNVRTVFGDQSAVFSTVQGLPYSASFGPLPLCSTIGISYALFKNKQGQVISPTEERELEFNWDVEDNQFESLPGLLIDRPTITRPLWPFVALSFFLINETSNYNCTSRAGVLKYFYWIYTDNEASNLANNEGYIPLGTKFRDVIVPHLMKIKCQNEILLQYSIIPKNPTTGQVMGLVVSFLLLFGVPVAMGFIVHRIKSQTSKVFIILMTIASMINFLTPLFWFLEPSDGVCAARQWLTCFGISLLMTLVFNLTLQYYYIKQTYMKNNKLGAKIPFLSRTITLISVIMGIQFVFLIIWSSMDPYRSSLTILDQTNFITIRSCSSTFLYTWFSIECGYLLFLLLFGIFCVTYTWHLLTKSSRWLVMCIYNTVVALLLIVVYLSMAHPTDEELYLVLLLFMLVITVGFDFAILMPKVVEVHRSSSRSGSQSQRTSLPTRATTQHTLSQSAQGGL